LSFEKLDLDFMNIEFEDVKEKPLVDLEKLKDLKHEYRKKQKLRMEETGESIYGEQNDYILTIVFNTNKDKQTFNKKIGIKNTEKYVKGSKIYDIIQPDYRW
jgi:hypothetical protein